MAWWPKDRLVGLSAAGDGVVVTKPAPWGRELHLNADASRGSVTAELLREDGSVAPGFDAESCVPLAGRDSLDHKLQWRDGASNVSEEGNAKGIRLRVRDAEVFSLWWE
jgi:hypothetical protein